MNLARILGCLLLLLLTVGSSYGQRYNFHNYDIEDGLPRTGVYDLLEDRDGFLWIANDGGGVSVFDGFTFKNYNSEHGLPNRNVRCILEDSTGTIWLGTENKGAYRFNGKSFEQLNIPELEQTEIRKIVHWNDTTLAMATLGNGVFLIDIVNNQLIEHIEKGLPHQNCRYVEKIGDELWVGTDRGPAVYTGSTTKNLSRITRASVLSIVSNGDGSIWMGTEAGVFHIQNRELIKRYTLQDGLPANRIKDLVFDSFGNLWLGSNNGLAQKDSLGFRVFTTDNGLKDDRIRALIADQYGSVWIGTFFGGISRYSGSHFVHFNSEMGLSNSQVLYIDQLNDSTMLLGTYEGVNLLQYERGAYRVRKNFNALINHRPIRHILMDDGNNYWASTDNGVYIFYSNRQLRHHIRRQEGLISSNVKQVAALDSSRYLIATDNGLSELIFVRTGNYLIYNYSQKDNLPGKDVAQMVQDSLGNYWIAFQDGGLCYYDSRQFYFPKWARSIPETNCLLLHKDQLWIGTNGKGIFRVEDYLSDTAKVEIFTTEDRIHTNFIHTLSFDKNNNLWAGTHRGIERLRFTATGQFINSRFYGNSEGFKGIEVNPRASFTDSHGNLWFGTVRKLTRFSPMNIHVPKQESNTFITGVRLFFQQTDWSTSNYSEGVEGKFDIPKQLTLPYNQNHLTFDFLGLYLKTPSKVQYQWMIEGFDDNWSLPSYRNEVTYTNLPPGSYTFKLISSNEYGIWNTEPTTFEFTIKAPFWQTTWFISLSILTLLLLVYLIFQWRIKRLKAAKIELAKQVRARTHELQKEKEVVEKKSAEIQKQNEKIEEQKQRLEKTFADLQEKNKDITDSIHYAQKIQTAIMQPRHDDLQKLKANMSIFYEPRDIVSGDFFWLTEKNDHIFIGAADCTGHGVPGAFMSMIGITFLNQIVNKRGVFMPDEILNRLRRNIINALQHDGNKYRNDGMDIALCVIDKQNKKLYCSGANNPVYILRDKAHGYSDEHIEMYEQEEIADKVLLDVKTDRMPIGMHDNKDVPFTLHEIDLQPTDRFFIFSDGIVDQFGGPKGKKMLSKRLKNILLKHSASGINEQVNAVEQFYTEWKNEEPQIDDIILIGVDVGVVVE